MFKRMANKEMFKKVHTDNTFSPNKKDERVTYVTFLPNPDEFYLTTEIKQYVKVFWKFGAMVTTEKKMLAVPPSLMHLMNDIKDGVEIDKEYFKSYREVKLEDFRKKVSETVDTVNQEKDLTTGDKETFIKHLESEEDAMFQMLKGLEDTEEEGLKSFLSDAEYLGKTAESMVSNTYYFARANEESLVIIEVSGIYLQGKEKLFSLIGANTHAIKLEAIKEAVDLLDKQVLEIVKKEAN